MGFLIKLFGGNEIPETDDSIQSDVCCAETLLHAAPALHQENLRAINLERWKASDEALLWVRTHSEGWNHTDWLELFASLKNSVFWPMDEDAIGLHLEHLRDSR